MVRNRGAKGEKGEGVVAYQRDSLPFAETIVVAKENTGLFVRVPRLYFGNAFSER
jgi:hypothetical protein